MKASIARTLCMAAVLCGVAGPAAAFDLTGTWSGTTSCTSLFQGEKFKFKDAPTLQVTQVGDAIGVRADYGGGDVDLYTGHAYPDAKKPNEKGEIALIACGTDSTAGNGPAFDEVGRFTISTKTGKIKATIKGLSFFSDPLSMNSPEIGTCKWSLTRTALAGSGVSTACGAETGVALSAGAGGARDRSPAEPRHRRR
jgi:hypothetical protein